MVDKIGWTEPLCSKRDALEFLATGGGRRRRWSAMVGGGRGRSSINARTNGCEITMTDGAWRVNGEAWDKGNRCAAGEVGAAQGLRGLSVLTTKRGEEARAHAVSGAAR